MVGTSGKMNIKEAGDYLGITRQKIWQLVKKGKLKTAGENPLDGRQKLIRVSDLDKLKKYVDEKEVAGD